MSEVTAHSWRSMRKLTTWLFSLFLLIILFFAGYRAVMMEQRLSLAQFQLEQLRSTYERLNEENRTLSDSIILSGREDVMESLARNRLGYVLPEDRIYIIDSGTSTGN